MKHGTKVKRFIGALVAVLGVPGSLPAVVAAKQSRVMIVHVDAASHGVLETFEASAAGAGLGCRRSDAFAGRPAVQCSPLNTSSNEGSVTVVDRTEKRAVVISAFARNVATPQGELHPSIDETLRQFKATLAANRHVLRIDECRAPDLRPCSLPN